MKALFLFITIVISTFLHAQPKNIPKKFEVVVSFGSMCCGTPSDAFLKTYIKRFSKVNKIIIPAFKVAGCGREGEYKILFSIAKLKPAIRKKFHSEIKSLVAKEEKRNRAKDSSSGTINLEYNQTQEDVSFCRESISRW